MKASELAVQLMENPDYEVHVSIRLAPPPGYDWAERLTPVITGVADIGCSERKIYLETYQ